MAVEGQGVVPMLSYADGQAAMEWLARVFGFVEEEKWLDGDVLAHGEMSTGGGSIMLATPTADYEGPLAHRAHCESAAAWSSAPWVIDGVLVRVDDLVGHYDRAVREGATMLSGVENGPGGSQLFRVEDLEGHRWMFMENSP
jgi:uncharacterized glyoxalase superfamily protein PhnB